MKIAFLDAATMGDVSFEPFERLGDFTRYENSTPEEARERVKELDVLLINKVMVDKQLIDSAPNLKLICIAATGVNNIDVEYAVSHQSAIYRMTFLKKGQSHLILNSANGDVKVEGNVITGSQTIQDQTKVYVYMETCQKPVQTDYLNNSCVTMTFDEDVLDVRYGVSFISVEQAEKNLRREISDYDLDKVKATGRKIWNDVLGRMEVKGGDEDYKTVFYTLYYRNFERPVCISEDGRYWSGFDNSVHEDGGVPFYNDDWIWDTYHASHPLRIMMNKEVEEDILASYLRIRWEQCG